jgi:small acid-soluble spore protein F (minor alpha/beta-type SASP)
MEKIKRSRKSKIKKRPDDWEELKVEIAQELGLWPKVASDGWAGLSAEESGRLGGVFSARKKALAAAGREKENKQEIEI